MDLARESFGQLVAGRLLRKLRRGDARNSAAREASALPFLDFVEAGEFKADGREDIDLRQRWRCLRELYGAVPETAVMMDRAARGVRGLDLTVMKPTQFGASIWGMFLSMWLQLRGFSGGYFLPVATTALYFSEHRFLKLVRQNPSLHRLMGDPAQRGHGAVDEGSKSVRILGDGRAYFTYMGGKVTTEALALDWLILDEVQEMLLSDIQKVEERIASSALKLIARVSTANFVGADIHHFYQLSDRREFHTRCGCPEGVVLTDCWDPTVGPLCIDRGNGTTPSVPTTPFYFCPKCTRRIDDPQDGRFIAHAPQVPDRIGFHWGQMLSPWQTPTSILEKWRTRVDTAHFYRRVLGMPYTDPDSQPVTETMLINAQNPDLRWGPPERHEVTGVFMGLDQMGHDIHCVIGARVGEKLLRLLHVEIIQSDNPWKRAAELMDRYHVRFCGVEALPNFNEAHRFAKAFDGRVFVVYYQDHLDEILTWGDRPHEKATVRRSDDAFKTRYTASADQYKLMSLALNLWARGMVETPDARELTQTLRTSDGERPVQVVRDPKLGFWLHLQRVALVTELPEGREDERKPRRAVKKIGIDPHFAYAWMLLMVGVAREYGTERILGDVVERPDRSKPAEPQAAPSYADQLRKRVPGMANVKLGSGGDGPRRLTCNNCAFFDAERRYCDRGDYQTEPDAPKCDSFVPVPEEDKHWR